MLMSGMKAPDYHTPLVNKWLELVNASDGTWLRLSDLARLAGKARVNPYDQAVLKKLANEGLIESEQQQMGLVRTAVVYRKKSSKKSR